MNKCKRVAVAKLAEAPEFSPYKMVINGPTCVCIWLPWDSIKWNYLAVSSRLNLERVLEEQREPGLAVRDVVELVQVHGRERSEWSGGKRGHFLQISEASDQIRAKSIWISYQSTFGLLLLD